MWSTYFEQYETKRANCDSAAVSGMVRSQGAIALLSPKDFLLPTACVSDEETWMTKGAPPESRRTALNTPDK
jgi:hypothetical protein